MFKPMGGFKKPAPKPAAPEKKKKWDLSTADVEDEPPRKTRRIQDDDDDEAPPQFNKKKKIAAKPEAPKRPPTPQEVKEALRAERARSTALATTTPKKPAALPVSIDGDGVISDEARRVLNREFKDKADFIIQQLEEQNTDGAVSLLSRSVLQMLVRLLPLAEQTVIKSEGGKGIYQLNQMVSSVREMLTDLQALRDKGLLGHRIVERTIRPAFMDIGGQIVLGFVELEAKARKAMSPEDFRAYQQNLNDTKRALAEYMQAQYADIQEQVIASLS